MPIFLRIWSGQLAALVGSGVSAFALNLWILQQSGSISRFALAFFFTSLPGLLLAPFSGAWVDRHDRRRTMLMCDAFAGLITLVLLGLYLSAHLAIWQLYVAMVLQSCIASLRWPAYQALTTTLAPREHLPRVAGMVQLAEACNQIFSPALAGSLLSLIGLRGILIMDVCASSVAMVTLFSAQGAACVAARPGASLLADIRYSLGYLRQRPGLMRLLGYFAGMNFGVGMVMVLATPLVLSFATPRVLGQVLSISATGMLLGSVAMIALKRNVSLIKTILAFSLLSGLAIGIAGLHAAPWWFAAAGFAFFFSIAMVNAGSQALWQTQVDPAVQGRVFSARRVLSMFTLPLAYLAAGPLAEAMEGLMRTNGPLAAGIGQVLGVGQGRGIALLFVCIGLYIVLLTQYCMRNDTLRALETAHLPAPAVF